mgnify:CR=1 FL=1
MDFLRATSYYKSMQKTHVRGASHLKQKFDSADVRDSSRRYSVIFYVMLIMLPLLAMAVCWWIGVRQSVWFDESYSIWLARQPVGELVRLTGLDTHPPLYYMVLKAWAGVWGFGEAALRSLSVICYGLSIIVAALFARRWFGVKPATYVLVLLSCMPLFMRYGFEIRMYAMASLICVSASAVLVRAWYSRSRWWWGVYAVLVALGMLTVYYTAFLWMAHVVWLAVMSYKQGLQLKSIRAWLRLPWVWAYVGSVALFVPWLPVFVGQLGNGALAPIAQPMNIDQLVGIISFNTLYKPTIFLGTIASILVISLVLFVIWAWPRALRQVRYRAVFWLLVVHCVVPIGILLVISIVSSMYVERYLTYIATSFATVLGVVVYAAVATDQEWTIRRRIAVLAFVPVMMLYGVGQLYWRGNFNFQRDEQPDTRRVVADLQNCRDGSVLLATDPYIAVEISYYLHDTSCTTVFFMDDSPTALTGGYAPLETSSYRKVRDSTRLFTTARRIKVLYYWNDTLPILPQYRFISESGDVLKTAIFERM